MPLPPTLVRSLLPAVGVALLALVPAGSGGQPATLTSDEVAKLEKAYHDERQAADKAGLTRTFSPEWFTRADALAKLGSAALKAGRLYEARDSFRRARWTLPSRS